MNKTRVTARSSRTAAPLPRWPAPHGSVIPSASGKATGSWLTPAASTTKAGLTTAAGRIPKPCTPSNASAAVTSVTWTSKSPLTIPKPTPSPGRFRCNLNFSPTPKSSKTCARTRRTPLTQSANSRAVVLNVPDLAGLTLLSDQGPSVSTLARSLVTCAKFLRQPERPDGSQHYELHDGEVVTEPPARPLHIKLRKRIES